MNYARIYAEFIRDRLHKQPEKPEYFEVHHIKPRCLGGGNESENLIRLTPEDHYFAHMLLAHMHGGKLWIAAQAMGQMKVGDRDLLSLRKRVGFGIARRRAALWFSENHSGGNSPAADPYVYILRHKGGTECAGRRFELQERTGLNQKAIHSLVHGEKLTYNGWFNPEILPRWEDRKRLMRTRRSDVKQDRLTLYHQDGVATWKGTRAEFKDEFGIPLSFQSDVGHCQGWFRDRAHIELSKANRIEQCFKAARARGCISGGNNPRADRSLYQFESLATGEVKSMTRTGFAQMVGATPQAVSGLLRKDRRDVNGWTLHGVVWRRALKGAIYRFVSSDGRAVSGSRAEIASLTGLTTGAIGRIIREKTTSPTGWRWDGEPPSYPAG